MRVLQSKTNEKKLARTKFAVKDKSGKVFRYMSYGNTHHVEIIQHRETAKVKGEFVTMMEASHRAKGIKSELNPEGKKQPIIKTDHGEGWQFLMALHRDDTVSVEKDNGEREFYRVQKLNLSGDSFELRPIIEATLKTDNFRIGINKDNFDKYDIRLHRINAIGCPVND